jgi:UDP-hydrolysing UDP-N-acetyl-D-glucosamine 2-epimerase
MKRIGVVTVARSDFSIYRPVLKRLAEHGGFTPEVLVSGMHLSPEFGLTVREVEAAGFGVAERVEMLLSADSPAAIAKSLGLGVIGFADVFARWRPDALLVLGDRFEMLAAALAAMPFNIVLVHLHGGEATEGVIDDAIRHAMTKMSHVHFVSTTVYAERLIQMGEQPWRVVVSGAPSLDNLADFQALPLPELERRLGMALPLAPLVVTFHPVTLDYAHTDEHVTALLEALADTDRPVVFTYPNADTSGRRIIEHIERFVAAAPRAVAVRSLGTEGYFSLLHHAAAMVGNSSSGIIEAASFGLPVVNVGDRQRGRVHGANVVDVPCEVRSIRGAIREVTSEKFQSAIRSMANPYGGGNAAEVIATTLDQLLARDDLLRKPFYQEPLVSA